MKKQFLLFFLLTSEITACSHVDVPSLPEEIPSSTMPAVNATQMKPEEESTQMSQPTLPSGMEPLVDQAKKDLAQRLSILVNQIELIRAESVTWPDASLGCPLPGMAYKQVPEDGALIILQAEGINYEYHTGGNRGLFLCESTYKDPSSPPKIDIFDLTPSKPKSDSSSDPTLPDNGIPPGEDQ